MIFWLPDLKVAVCYRGLNVHIYTTRKIGLVCARFDQKNTHLLIGKLIELIFHQKIKVLLLFKIMYIDSSSVKDVKFEMEPEGLAWACR